MPLHDLRHLIGAAPDLASVRKHARKLASLQKAFIENTPVELAALTKASRVGYIKAGTLFLLADHAAAAAKLRQLLPRLLPVFQNLEPEVTGIKVEVQVKTPAAGHGTASGKTGLPVDSIEHFDHLAQTVRDPELKRALGALVKKRRKTNG